MIPLQRKQVLIEYLSKHGSESIGKLSEILSVSEMTIRRDLQELESGGAVQRTHGGAIYIQDQQSELRFEEKIDSQRNLKDKLAKYAVEHFVHNNGVIFLEGGTTVTCMANYISGIANLTVITNGFNTVEALKKWVPHSSVICCGGILRDVAHTFVGSFAEKFFSQVHAEAVFLSASGLTREEGFTDPNMLESQVKRTMSNNAKKKIMLLDSTKFGKCSLLTTFNLSEIDVLITDEGMPKQMLKTLQEHDIEIRIVSET